MQEVRGKLTSSQNQQAEMLRRAQDICMSAEDRAEKAEARLEKVQAQINRLESELKDSRAEAKRLANELKVWSLGSAACCRYITRSAGGNYVYLCCDLCSSPHGMCVFYTPIILLVESQPRQALSHSCITDTAGVAGDSLNSNLLPLS